VSLPCSYPPGVETRLVGASRALSAHSDAPLAGLRLAASRRPDEAEWFGGGKRVLVLTRRGDAGDARIRTLYPGRGDRGLRLRPHRARC